jgi:hypothetical protein
MKFFRTLSGDEVPIASEVSRNNLFSAWSLAKRMAPEPQPLAIVVEVEMVAGKAR